MNYSHRFFLYGPVGLFTALLLATMGYWWFASDAFSKHLDALNNRDVAPGVHFSFAKKTIAGFPFRLDAELDGLRIEIATSHGPTVWTAERFATHSLMYGSPQFVFEAAGQQHIAWHDDAGQLHAYDFLPGSLRASAIMRAARLARFDLDALNVDSPDISASEVQLHLREDPKIDGLDLYFVANNVHFAPDEAPPFGPDMKHFVINAMVSPGSSFAGLLSGHGDWRAAADDWHARHGGVLVNAVEVNWGPLDATGKGALAVDDLHRPVGTLNFLIADSKSLTDSLKKRIPFFNGDPNYLGLEYGAFFAMTNLDTKAPTKISLAFRNGSAYVGILPIDHLSPLF